MNFAEEIIANQTETGRMLCPECSSDRRHKNPTLSVTVNPNETLYHCHHCSFNGLIPTNRGIKDYTAGMIPKPLPEKVIPIPTKLNQDKELIRKFFTARGVDITNMSALPPMTTDTKFFHDMGEVDAVGFVYGDRNNPSAIKWRAVDQKMFTATGAAREFYGLAQLDKSDTEIIIVEGEADVIALGTIGIKAVSCPNGAPMKVSHGRLSPEEDNKFAYIWEARDLLKKATKIILAVDQDEPGEALAEEIARRVGRARCWRTTYPEGCNDLTDVLAKHGGGAVKIALDQSAPVPLAGVYGANMYSAELQEIYRDGHGKGVSTGMPCVDELFTIKEGQLSIVTGMPSSGKSEFVDQMMVNLAMKRSWKFAVASFENPPAVHIAKLAEKVVGKPFFEGTTPRMSKKELDEATVFINEHFVFLESRDGSLATIDSIIDRAEQAIMRLGVRGLVIDPYNYIEHDDGMEGEHQTINKMLTKIGAFGRANDVHIWFVAHPAKMYPRDDGTYAIPKGMSISGSAAWFSKADIGVTVHRGPQGVEIHCWKVRFKWIGKQGMTYLGYDVPTGRYFEGKPDDHETTLAPDKLKKYKNWHETPDDWDLPF